jgi:large subunit ribosomal protein L4
MPTVPVLDGQGGVSETLELSADVFGGAVRVPLLHQSVVREMAARHVGTHDTKGRSEVSGGGRKPWRQKGTGRARQGSIRATQWKGGGKPFGPTPRSYDQRMPSQMRRAALREALAAKIAAGGVSVVERFALGEPRTSVLTRFLDELGVEAAPTLLVVGALDPGLARAARNVPWLRIETAAHTSVYQVLRHSRVIFEKGALLGLQEMLSR